jgi:rubrerythrin
VDKLEKIYELAYSNGIINEMEYNSFLSNIYNVKDLYRKHGKFDIERYFFEKNVYNPMLDWKRQFKMFQIAFDKDIISEREFKKIKKINKNIMICPNCSAEVEDNNIDFCPFCGSKLIKTEKIYKKYF